MAGETVRTEAVCLDIRPWSQTSHVVSWLTPDGRIATVVKGAVRPKSAFLGQYDLNYTCEIVYYARAKGDLHPLRECSPLALRERLRGDWRALALAAYFRQLAAELSPSGPDCRPWFGLLSGALDGLASGADRLAVRLARFELRALELAGLRPDFSGYSREAEWSAFSVESGAFGDTGGRCVRIARPVAEFLANPRQTPSDPKIPLDACRVLGVFYQFHLGCASEVRRPVMGMVSKEQGRYRG